MRLYRFFIDSKAVSGNRIIVTDKEVISQMKKVLRLKTGDDLILLDNSGKEYKTKIQELGQNLMRGEILETSENKNEPELKVTLYQALCKKDKFEWILQKGTEVGILEFVPVITERTEKLGLNFERAEKILKEAAEQSERGMIPKLSEAQNFEDVIKNLTGEKILLDKSGISIKNYTLTPKPYTLNVLVGPEGGWTEQELKVAKENGVKIVSLGSRVLRTETAGMVAVAILLNR
ncbi:MAG: 16S rRNA (uracil(1498)-N(3))-methyltransferase [Candidatus Harrisonbacteria bacterium]|nr:16S rRNA (uracil(1498)-N(3))-methyltransferase [Candidatus Harrisonbacteria bacterium]